MINLVELRKAQLKITRENLANIQGTCDEMRERGIADISPDQHEDLKQELLAREAHLVGLLQSTDDNVISFEEAQMCSDLKKFSRSI